MDIEFIENLETEYPWQRTPLKIIWYACSLAEKGGDFASQTAFLLCDVGMETLFKTYLSLDNKITGSKLQYGNSMKIVNGNSFFNLIQGMKEATEGDIDPDLFDRVMHFHKIRNKIYHQGDGVTITSRNLAEYTYIAETLLFLLLNTGDDPGPNYLKPID